MLKFVMGVVLGVMLAFGYVRWNIDLPAFLTLPDKVRGNIVSTATEAELYDVDGDPGARRRALEVLFANRADFAAKVDSDAGHPFLAALLRERASREARQLAAQWTAFDAALAKPALREAEVRRHGTVEPEALKRAMLYAALDRQAFLKAWLARNAGPVTPENLREVLRRVGAGLGAAATPARP
jgi:hypothetical protein